MRALAVGTLLWCPGPLSAQQDLESRPAGAHTDAGRDSLSEWNDPRVLELVRQARDIRQSTAADSSLRSYRAEARGFVYFMVDRTDNGERTLVKADQVALEVFWRSPGDTRQRIVGMRDEKVLPTNIRYHLDHLTIVQDEFGDLIRIGDGDEVEAVLHPAAPGAERSYDYRLTDSLTLAFAGARAPITVYEIEVRPRDLDQPGFLGTLSVDRATGAIVRLNFSFTPASYVDPYLDYIRISLENALWLDRHWLPYRQEAELRREVPALDFLGGTVIRGRFRIADYRFNDSLPDLLFAGRSVLRASPRSLESFVFEDSLFSDLDREGLAPSADLEQIRQRAGALALERALSGLPPVRLFWSSFSDGLRYNRAEGLFMGAGSAMRVPGPLPLRLRAHGGWSFGREAGSARLELAPDQRDPNTRITADWWALRDLGPVPAASPVVNSLASLAQQDYMDPWFETGVTASHRWRTAPSSEFRFTVRHARQHSAKLTIDTPGNTAFRPVRPIETGDLSTVELGTRTRPVAGAGWHADARVAAHHLNNRAWGQIDLSLDWRRPGIEQGRALGVATGLRVGSSLGADPAPQSLYLLGGRATLPGHAHRSMVGRRYWLVHTDLSVALVQPWIGLRLGAAAGGVSGLDRLPNTWTGALDPTARGSVWMGTDLLWSVLRLDVARGIGPGGDWALVFSVAPKFHEWL